MTGQVYTLQVDLDGTFTNVPLFATPVTIERGMEAYGEWPGKSGFTCEIADDTYQYDPSRPTSLLYGVAGRNAKVRIRPNANSYLYAEAQKWTPQRTPDHVPGAGQGRSGVLLAAEGLLSRIGRWEDPLDSPMYRTIAGRSTSAGHWSMEDGRGATRLDNSLAGGVGGVAQNGAELGDDEAPAGAGSSARIADGSRLAGTFATMSTSAGWQVSWAFRADALPPTAVGVELFRVRTANGYVWTWFVDNTSFYMQVRDSDGTLIEDDGYIYGSGAAPDANWLTMRIAVEQVAGNVSWNWAWYAQDLDVFYVPTGSFAGVISRPVSWEQNGNATTEGWWFCHVFGVTSLVDDLMSAANRNVFNGYNGETAIDRYYRLMSEAGLTRYGIGTASDSQPMGPQKPKTLLELLKEVRDTEWADLSDERLDVATTIRGRREMENQTPVLELTHVAAPAGPGDLAGWVKVVGTDGIANRINVRNAAGGEVTLELESGPLSTQPPPAGIGALKKQIDVSVADTDAQLKNIANWHLARLTLDGPRYTEITLDLNASPALLVPARGVREGDLITVDGLEADQVRLLVVGIERSLTSGTDRITYRTEPYDLYDIGVWDDPSFVWDAKYSTLDGDHTDTDNTLLLSASRITSVWSTAFTGDLMIAGERVTVTSMGAASGTGPWTQTATVVRSVNGVVKALPDDAAVVRADARRWGL